MILLSELAKKHETLGYFVLAYLISWSVGIPLALAAQEKGQSLLSHPKQYRSKIKGGQTYFKLRR